jgi:hypothetical protein
MRLREDGGDGDLQTPSIRSEFNQDEWVGLPIEGPRETSLPTGPGGANPSSPVPESAGQSSVKPCPQAGEFLRASKSSATPPRWMARAKRSPHCDRPSIVLMESAIIRFHPYRPRAAITGG